MKTESIDSRRTHYGSKKLPATLEELFIPRLGASLCPSIINEDELREQTRNVGRARNK
jgi:hypothetical protein